MIDPSKKQKYIPIQKENAMPALNKIEMVQNAVQDALNNLKSQVPSAIELQEDPHVKITVNCTTTSSGYGYDRVVRAHAVAKATIVCRAGGFAEWKGDKS